MSNNQSDKFENDLPQGIGKPAHRALLAAGYVRLEQLTKISEAELSKLHGVGPKAIKQLRQALNNNGLDFSEN